MTFGPLQISYDERVLTPRPWTTLQAAWASELLDDAPDGPVLEIGSGAGQIGLLAITDHRRRLVCVDSSEAACDYARMNADTAGLAGLVDVRESDLTTALRPDERFALVIADPPWVPRDETSRFPEDPITAIDGGPDGLDAARAFVRTALPHLMPGGSLLLQLGTPEQVEALADEVSDVEVVEVRVGESGVVARLRQASQAVPSRSRSRLR